MLYTPTSTIYIFFIFREWSGTILWKGSRQSRLWKTSYFKMSSLQRRCRSSKKERSLISPCFGWVGPDALYEMLISTKGDVRSQRGFAIGRYTAYFCNKRIGRNVIISNKTEDQSCSRKIFCECLVHSFPAGYIFYIDIVMI